jgi:HD-GYP domain-containing protein (c-di-GMP phosphodiesterase class II)
MLVGNLPEFRKGRELILSHHERFDGRGYPRALAGAAIPLGARIMTVADAFDAMTSHRSYRRAQPREYVIDQLRRGRGTQFDPAVVDVFIEMITVGKHAPEYWQAEAPHDHASSATLAVHSAGLPA